MILAHLPFFLHGEGVSTTTRCRSFYGTRRVTIMCVGVKYFSWYGRMLILCGGISDFRFQLKKQPSHHPLLLVKRIVII